MNFDITYRNEPPIPPLIREGLANYINHHCPTGGCLRAILQNDLREAITRADTDTRASMGTILCFLYNEAPPNCYGSPEVVKAWLDEYDGDS